MNFSTVHEGHGYKELTLPAGPNGEWLMEKNALHLWPRGDFMFMCCPDLDGSHTCTLFLSYKGLLKYIIIRWGRELCQIKH